jgi:hypothetical protein
MKWAEARSLGLPKYNTGKPCKHGHLSDRYTHDSHCVACTLGWGSTYRKTPERADWKKSYENTAEARALHAQRNARLRAKPDKAAAYKVTKKRWQQANLWRGRLYRAQRDERVKRATPPWVDLAEIERFYVFAERISQETGIPHEVDHFYPLVGRGSCGLHVPWNLRVIPMTDNRKKSNKPPSDDSQIIVCAQNSVYPESSQPSRSNLEGTL